MEVEPIWLQRAREYLGTRERLADGSPNPLIHEFFQSTGFKQGTAADAWCSAFANHCMHLAGIRGSRAANARSWRAWGVRLPEPRVGCVVVFSRPPSPTDGHIAFYVRETQSLIYVLGGNQGNSVCIAPYPRSRLLAYRWPEEPNSDRLAA